MTFKTVLFPLGADRAAGDVSKIVGACNLQDAHKIMLLVQVAPSLPIAVEMPVSDQWIEEMNDARELAGETGRTLERLLNDAGSAAEVQAVVSERFEIEEIVGLRSRYADLSVLSWSLFGDHDIFKRSLIGLLFQSGKPVLVESAATKISNTTLTPQTVMIAWDGGLPASRAVGHSIDLLRQANDVHIVCVDPKVREPEYGQAPGWDLAAYLSRFNVNITVTQLSGGGQATETVLTRHASEIGAQLIVMGGYGHSRLRERLLGGTTRAMIEHSQIPIIMAH